MAMVSGLTVANLYYNQPLLEDIRKDLNVNEVQANFITFVTQVGYALGLLLVVPLADMWSRRKIAATSMILAAMMAVVIAFATQVQVLWAASLVLGVCSVIPQMFVPMARLYSLPQNQSRNMGYVLSGLLSGVLGARVVSGYVGDWLGWRTMFGVAAVIMLVCLVVSLRMLPRMRPTYQGSFAGLMHSILHIYKEHTLIRLYSVRAAFAFGSMMTVWFHSSLWHYAHFVSRQFVATGCLDCCLVLCRQLLGTYCYHHPCGHWRTMPPTQQPKWLFSSNTTGYQSQQHHFHVPPFCGWKPWHALCWFCLECTAMDGGMPFGSSFCHGFVRYYNLI